MKNYRLYLFAIIVLIIAQFATLYMLSISTENSATFSRYFNLLLLAATAGLLILIVIVAAELYRLFRAYQRGELGVLMRGRLMLFFALISIVPAATVYFVSNHFLQRGLDSWVNVEVEGALKDSLQLSQTAINVQRREIDRQMRRAALQLRPSAGDIQRQLVETLRQTDAIYLDLFARNGLLISTASYDTSFRAPRFPASTFGRYLGNLQTRFSLEQLPPYGLVFRAVTAMPSNSSAILQGYFPVASEQTELAENVSAALDRYRELGYLKTPLKQIFSTVLIFVVLFSLLVGLLMALRASDQLTQPIVKLAQGTRRVAGGDYTRRLDVAQRDELGDLVNSFNLMTESLAETQDKLAKNQQLIEQQNDFLENVMKRLSSGVITIGVNETLVSVNDAAERILGFELRSFVGVNIDFLLSRRHRVEMSSEQAVQHALAGVHSKIEMPDYIETFLAQIDAHVQKAADWSDELKLSRRHQQITLMIRGSRVMMPFQNQYRKGYVIVFDDISGLIAAQRSAAWGEVAQRLAHEVKNPLTPIQLAAERMQRKLSASLPEAEAVLLEKSVDVISRQVSSLKDIVTEFSDFAKTSVISPSVASLQELVEEVHYLFATANPKVEMRLQTKLEHTEIYMDVRRIRQVLNNLYKNAIEAIETQERRQLCVSIDMESHSGEPHLTVSIEDNGSGFDANAGVDYFEPYVTQKVKGTGLGLAVVKKIIEEHRGFVQIGSSEQLGGAKITLYLPQKSQLSSKISS